MVTHTVLYQNFGGGKEYGWWHTQRASADLSIFPDLGIAFFMTNAHKGPVSLPLGAGTLILVNQRDLNIHELSINYSILLMNEQYGKVCEPLGGDWSMRFSFRFTLYSSLLLVEE